MARKISIVLFTDDRSQPVRLSLNVFWCYLGCIVMVSSFLVLSYFGFEFYSSPNERREVAELHSQNARLQGQLGRYSGELASLRAELQELVLNDARIRQLAGGEPGSQELPVAVGGISEAPSELSVDSLNQQISHLQRELEKRRNRQEEVRNLLNDKVSLSRSTPKGWPTRGWLTSYFGKRLSPFSGRQVVHEGLDIAANTGTPIYATADGVVARVSYSPSYGKTLVIDHGYGYRTIFGHTSKILVTSGQQIRRGDRIALVGNTGRSTGPHLHYELRLNGVPIDPRKTL